MTIRQVFNGLKMNNIVTIGHIYKSFLIFSKTCLITQNNSNNSQSLF